LKAIEQVQSRSDQTKADSQQLFTVGILTSEDGARYLSKDSFQFALKQLVKKKTKSAHFSIATALKFLSSEETSKLR
jgi:hypothetical protein